jgi:hypothetical protein
MINNMNINAKYMKYINYDPTDGVSTLSWWLGLSVPETLRAMPAVA